MKVRPLGDRVIVKRIEGEETTEGGIVIPDTAREKQAEGRAISVGQGFRDEDGKFVPLEIKKGDRIIFSKYAGTEVKIEGDEYLIMREEDVLAVVE